MSKSKSFDSPILMNKEIILGAIKEAISKAESISSANMDFNAAVNPFKTISQEQLKASFIDKFRSTGRPDRGFLMPPCTSKEAVKELVELITHRRYNTFLNTVPYLSPFLDRHNINYTNSIYPNQPADAALVFSDMLIARNGSIGFAQEYNIYPSVIGLARDLIVFARERCIYPDVEQALEAKKAANEFCAMTEFIAPTAPEIIDGKARYTPWNPRIILMLIQENAPKENVSQENVPQEKEPAC